MTPKQMHEMREAFESAWRARYPEHDESAFIRSHLEPDSYVNTRVNDAWWAWREAQKVTLSGVDLSYRDLLGGAMRNIEPRNRQGTPRWSLVRDAIGNGSGVSTALCRHFGYDPDEYLSTDPNYATDNKVLAHLRGIDGSTAWVMTGAVGMEREDVSKSLQRLKRRGLVQTSDRNSSYWRAV